jgi:hypothetical protein
VNLLLYQSESTIRQLESGIGVERKNGLEWMERYNKERDQERRREKDWEITVSEHFK